MAGRSPLDETLSYAVGRTISAYRRFVDSRLAVT